MIVIVTLLPFSQFAVEVSKTGTPVTLTALIALLVCLIPTTIGGLLSAIGVAGIVSSQTTRWASRAGKPASAACWRARRSALTSSM